MKDKAENMGKAAISVVLFTLIAKLLGFFRELLLSNYFGATGISDAYLISQTIPGTIFQFVGTGLATCFIPIYYKIFNKEGKNGADRFTNQIMSVVFVFSTIVMLIVWIFAPYIVRAFAIGFEGDTFDYALAFTRIGITSLYFSTVIYVSNSYLQANKNFLPTAFSGIPNSLIIMLAIILGGKYNVWILSIGSVVAVAFQMLFVWIPTYRLGLRVRPTLKWNNEYIREFFVLMIPVIIGVSVNEINVLVDRTVASQVAVGAISALTYANSLIMCIQGGLVQPIVTVCYPSISQNIAVGNQEQARDLLKNSINILLAILIPITVGLMLYSKGITTVLFGRGKFDEYAIYLTSEAIKYYAVGICFVAIREMVSRYYYSHGDTSFPMKNATIGVVVNIVLNLTLTKFMGIGGLALATSVSAIVTAILLWRGCKTHLKTAGLQLQWSEIGKIAVATIVMGIVSYGVYCSINMTEMIRLIIVIFVAVVVYMIMAIVLEMEIVKFAMQFLDRIPIIARLKK